MALMPWPASLPQVLRLGSDYDPGEEADIFTPEKGPAEIGPVFTDPVERITGSMVLTAAQLATFRTFYRVTLKRGTDYFQWVHPLDGSVAKMRFKRSEGEGGSGWSLGDPVGFGGLYELRLDLEIWPL